MVSVFSILFRLRFVVIMTTISINSLLLLVPMIFTPALWIVLTLLLLNRFSLMSRLLVMLMLPSLEMAERSGCHEQPLPFAQCVQRRIKLLDGTIVRAWP